MDGAASIGVRLPVNSLKVDSSLPGSAADDTAIGDLFVVTKVLLYESEETGSLVSAGVAFSLPTGPSSFANSNYGEIQPPHRVNFQPYVGYIWRPSERLYIHGFSAVDIPVFDQDVALMYNDVGIGYFIYEGTGRITSIAPTTEIRVTTPLNHNGVLEGKRYGETNIIEVLSGVTFELNRRSSLAVGASVPVTGPKPYDWQFLTQINVRF